MKFLIFFFIFFFIKFSESRDCGAYSNKNEYKIDFDHETGIVTCCDFENCQVNITELSSEATIFANKLVRIYKTTEINFYSSSVLNLINSTIGVKNNLQIYRADETSFKSISYKNFLKMYELKILELINGELTTICSNTFNDLISLEELNLENNEIKFLHPNLLKNLMNLKKINLSDNSIEILHPLMFQFLINLEEIYFRGNELVYLDGKQFRNNIKISVLYLNENNFNFIHSTTFDNLKYLKDFNIDENPCINEIIYEYDNSSYLITSELKKNLIENCNRIDENIQNINEKIELYLKWFKRKSFMNNCKLQKSSTYEDFKLNSANKLFLNFTIFLLISFSFNNLL
ncbi:hypothetical protein PVAND_001112 [Polypedilum vanderplanki]|uniref:Leucine rich repeat protein n=1 Tax=Polypedilum vanderplanki TaxID=319348 RepID=A0A9J6BMD0_POLVA|nr:hypothetical protein PVAND_001112 [Polypedilum vanderplanki]